MTNKSRMASDETTGQSGTERRALAVAFGVGIVLMAMSLFIIATDADSTGVTFNRYINPGSAKEVTVGGPGFFLIGLFFMLVPGIVYIRRALRKNRS
ncbi:MAG: hypothetical protein JST38_08685 [Bacteroidetes bacterium]|nr:hypothetical protein [Bacteroidota bacterium]MBS1940938.1 hypothetical protein [Bacteroidota bacterium]